MSQDAGVYIALQVVVRDSLAKLLADEVAALEPDGVLIEDKGTLGGEGLPGGHCRVTLYTDDDGAETMRLGLRKMLTHHGSGASIAIERIDPQDWNAVWKSHYEPVDIGPRLRVVPAWMDAGPTERVIVRIDPGQAFGTGTHETTQLVARLLQELEDGCRGHSVLDIGTGSALLAIAAHKLGAGHVVGVDNDPVAIESANDNLELNDCAGDILLAVADRPGELPPARYDLVFANIISSILLRLRDDIVQRVRPGGLLLLSGVLADEEGAFAERFLPDGWVVERRMYAAEWVAFAVRCPA